MTHKIDSVEFRDALNNLSLRDRRIAHFYMGGDTMAEIAKKMGLSTPGVRKIIKSMQDTFIDFTPS